MCFVLKPVPYTFADFIDQDRLEKEAMHEEHGNARTRCGCDTVTCEREGL